MDVRDLIDRAGVRLGLWKARHIRDAEAVKKEAERRIDRSAAYLAGIKGIHAGRRGFVIGNGPSLRMEDLDRLKGEICIASNKIHMAFPSTEWRPSYYTVVDDLTWKELEPRIHTFASHVFIPSYLPQRLGSEVDIRTFRSLPNPSDLEEWTVLPFSADAGVGIHGGYTVTYVNLQLAVHLGLTDIYLIGCDHFYQGALGIEGKGGVDPGDVQNHFVPGYSKPGEKMNPALISRMTVSYRCARTYADQHGIRIYNATRGGHLEVFPRVDLDQVLGGWDHERR